MNMCIHNTEHFTFFIFIKMKKTLVFIVSILAILGIGNTVSACEEIDFDSYGTICVDLDKDGNTYDLNVDYSDLSLSHTNAYFYVLLPNKKTSKTSGWWLLSPRLTDNNSDFSYNYKTYNGYDSTTRFVKVYAIIGNEVRSTEVYYDFSDGDRSDEDNEWTSNGDLDNFYITLSDSTPSQNQKVTLNIKARDDDNDTISDYNGRNADIKVEYKTSSSSSWRLVTSTYMTLDDKSPRFADGTAKTYITFKYNYQYRVTVTDDDKDIDDYKIFSVGDSSSSTSNGNLDNFAISLSDSTPSKNQKVTLHIRALDDSDDVITDYDGSNADVAVEYRTSSSSTRRTATSTYASIDDTTPSFDNGIAETNITFKYNYEYRITVTDDSENIDDYKVFDVGGTSSSSNGDLDNFYVTKSDSSPDINEWVDLTIRARDNDNNTLTDYTDSVDFTVYYRTSSSNVRTPTTSSNYYSIGSNYVNGYDFSSSDDWSVTLNDFIKFRQKFEYKVVVEDSNDANLNGYTVFNLRNQNSDVDGFTASQLDTVTKIYNARNRMISSLKSEYSRLRTNNTWINMSDDFYENMKDVINNKTNREFDDYSDYLDAFRDRYEYTIDNR